MLVYTYLKRKRLYYLVHYICPTAIGTSYFEDSDFIHITYLLLKYDDLLDETTRPDKGEGKRKQGRRKNKAKTNKIKPKYMNNLIKEGENK